MIEGGAAPDIVFAGPGNDVVRGQAGNDYVYAADGDDRIDGGPGDDSIDGGDGDDVLDGGRAATASAVRAAPTCCSPVTAKSTRSGCGYRPQQRPLPGRPRDDRHPGRGQRVPARERSAPARAARNHSRERAIGADRRLLRCPACVHRSPTRGGRACSVTDSRPRRSARARLRAARSLPRTGRGPGDYDRGARDDRAALRSSSVKRFGTRGSSPPSHSVITISSPRGLSSMQM